MARAPKETFVSKMQGAVDRAQGMLFVDYTGMTVAQADQLRAKMRAAGVSYVVVKNTLMARTLAGKAYAQVSACFKGSPTGVVLGFEDPVTPAKLTHEFIKECDKLRIKGGVVDGHAIDAAAVEALSKLPSKQELQGQVVGLAMSPGSKLAGQIKSPAGKVVGAIEALCKRLGGQDE